MRRIETILTVAEDGMATTRVPPDVAPGDHRALLVIDPAEPDARAGAATVFGYAKDLVAEIGDIVSPIGEAWDAER